MKSRVQLMAAASAAAMLVSVRAQAAEAPQANTEADILVTARLRTEEAQRIPVSLTAVNGDALMKTYTVNTNQLSQLVPTLNYSSANPRNTSFTIRGLGSTVISVSQGNDGLEPGVGFYVDQVYHARPATAAFDFVDIERVEVLRGPQGTVFGKNSTAGVISVTSKKPEFRFGGEAEVSYGEHNFLQAKAAITGPLVADKLAFRLSGSITRRDGVIRNTRYHKDQNDIHNDAVRGQLLFTPSDKLSVRLIADWSNFKNECCTQVFVRVAPTLKPALQQYPSMALNAPGGPYVPPSFNPYDRKTDIDAPLGVDTNEGGVSGIADWNIGNATITSVTAWRFWNWDAANDRDYTGIPIQLTQHIPSRQDQYSQELRIASNKPGNIDYVAGLYYFHQKLVGHPISIYGPAATYWLLPADYASFPTLLDGYQTNGKTDFRVTSYAAFGEVTWRPISRLAITGGLRYTHEKKRGVYDVQAFGGLPTNNATLIAEKNKILLTQFYQAHLSNGSLTGRANIAYSPTDDIMAYASYARGQKSGGINMSGLPTYGSGVPGHPSGSPILTTAVIRPEKNTTWEVGLKTRLFDDKVTLNIDAFHTTVKDFQANVVDNAAVVALRSYLANIPKVTIKGIEVDFAARISPHFSLRAAGAYTKGKYAKYPEGPCPIELTGTATTVCNLTGKPMPGLPKFAGTFGGEYALPASPFGQEGEFYLRADAYARSKVRGDASDSAYTVIKGYTIVNGSVGFRAANGWEISVFARNLFNKNYLQNITVQAGNSGLIVGTPSDPRVIGVTLRARR